MYYLNNHVPAHILPRSSIPPPLLGIINTSKNHYRAQHLHISHSVDLSIVLRHVFFFASLCLRTNLRFMHSFHVHALHGNGCNRHFSGCLRQNVEEVGLCYMYLFNHGSASAGYSASMSTGGAKVDSSSTRQAWAPSVNISAEYPALPDHDSMDNPSKS